MTSPAYLESSVVRAWQVSTTVCSPPEISDRKRERSGTGPVPKASDFSKAVLKLAREKLGANV